jgi:Asp-tRNA(Asn)/Glu-tRNA(Gln) amidotransferase A subunit family amidase
MGLKECLARIDARDGMVCGWTYLDRQAQSGAGPLAGVVLGVKDVIDVAGMPTTHGSHIFSDNIAEQDAEAVKRLRAAGAIVLGKTVTAEFATYQPGPTINPRKFGHTPGGSSSGSAAVVADGQADIALGTQTAGSIIRPGSFCGTIAYKPSFGRYPLAGVLETAPSLDTLGLFARNLRLLEAADAVLSGDLTVAEPNRQVRIGVCRTPAWDMAEPEMQHALVGFGDKLLVAGLQVSTFDLSEPFDRMNAAQTTIHRYEVARALGHIRQSHPDQISEILRAMIDAGAADSEDVYLASRELQQECIALLPAIFTTVDVLLAPAAPGHALEGLSSTGDPSFQRIWTAMGAPCLGFPVAWREDGLPLGLQLIGSPGTDRQLIADATTIIAHAALRET